MGDSLSFVLGHFGGDVGAGWWETVCHLGYPPLQQWVYKWGISCSIKLLDSDEKISCNNNREQLERLNDVIGASKPSYPPKLGNL